MGREHMSQFQSPDQAKRLTRLTCKPQRSRETLNRTRFKAQKLQRSYIRKESLDVGGKNYWRLGTGDLGNGRR
jgi:hypothetical protein